MCDFSDPRKMTNTFLAVIKEERNKYVMGMESTDKEHGLWSHADMDSTY